MTILSLAPAGAPAALSVSNILHLEAEASTCSASATSTITTFANCAPDENQIIIIVKQGTPAAR